MDSCGFTGILKIEEPLWVLISEYLQCVDVYFDAMLIVLHRLPSHLHVMIGSSLTPCRPVVQLFLDCIGGKIPLDLMYANLDYDTQHEPKPFLRLHNPWVGCNKRVLN